MSKTQPAITPDFRKLPAAAAHLKGMMLPPWLAAAVNEIGQAEVAGAKSNPRIIAYRDLAGVPIEGDDGKVPWCAVFVNAMLAKADVRGTASGLARSFASSPHFERLDAPILGCVTVISSPRAAWAGHVFFYTGENGLFLQSVGGNENDAVRVSMWQKKRLVGHFWPKGQPKPPAPYDKPVKLARPLLPHEKKDARDA